MSGDTDAAAEAYPTDRRHPVRLTEQGTALPVARAHPSPAWEVDPMKSDTQILSEVAEELSWEPRVRPTEIGITVDNGVVTLTGAVDSFAKRLAAEEAAHRVAGVLDVANDVQVHVPDSPTRTDTEIAHAVRHALQWDALVPEEQIQSTVTDGWVLLTGAVTTHSQREDAERAVQRLAGVRGIANRIVVEGPDVNPEGVRSSIEAALARRAEREAERINVIVRDGVVRLSGRVHSWAEKRAVIGAAAHAPGVASIDDDLRIEFG
jgi:osmotically-inducible protein OsmY